MYSILIAEDDSSLRYLYTTMEVWECYGFEIAVQVSNGMDALKLLEEQKFDLLLTDIRMPFLDGISLLKQIKEKNIDVVPVLASAYDKFEYARQGLIWGAFDYIVKPMNEAKLAIVLERARHYLNSKQDGCEMRQMVLDTAQGLGVKIEESSFVKNVCEYMSSHIQHKITMEEIASEMKLSKDYFGKTFKQQAGMSFNTFYAYIKVEYAKKLLDSGNYKAYEISDMLGYAHPDYFTKIFKDITGMTPRLYKNRNCS